MTRARWALVLGWLCAMSGVTAAERCVQITARPAVLLSKQDLRIEVRVWRHDDHRVLQIAWSVDGIYGGQSVRELSGASAAFLHTVGFRDQRPATYEFVATVFDQFGKAVEHDRATVRGPSEMGWDE